MWQDFTNTMLAWFNGSSWVFQSFIVVLITLFLALIEQRVFKKLLPRLKKTRTVWDDTIARALHRPLKLLIWVLGLSYAAEIAKASAENDALFKLVEPFHTLGVIVSITWFLNRFIGFAIENILQQRTETTIVDKTTAHAVGQVLRISVLITATLVAMDTLGYNISGVLAFGGIGGLAVSFAAKDMLANFFGGLMIYLDRPFSVGDWIRSPDRNIEGTVEYIGLRATRIRTFDKRPLYVPNGIFSNISVENPSHMQNRRIRARFGLRYEDAPKLREILTAIESMLRNAPEIDTTKTLMVNFLNFASSSLDIEMYTFTKTTHWVEFQAIQQEIFLKTIDIVTQHGAQIAFPVTTLDVQQPIKVESI